MSEHILEISHLSKSYEQHQALQDINISIPRGCIYGLLGPNGAGKTTLIRIINQIIMKDQGEIKLDGQALKAEHVHEIGYLPEERGLYKKMKVAEQLLYLAQLKGLKTAEAKKKIKSWLVKLDMDAWYDKKVMDLSKGMQQKIQFIATVLHDPKLIILDEPFSGFDPVNAQLIRDEILELRSKGTTVLFSTHRMESVEELCEYIALIHKSKKVLDGKKKEIKNKYRQNIFEVSHRGDLQDKAQLEILDHYMIDGLNHTKLRAPETFSPNQVLNLLIPQVEIFSFNEYIPTVNDIFINLVTQNEV